MWSSPSGFDIFFSLAFIAIAGWGFIEGILWIFSHLRWVW